MLRIRPFAAWNPRKGLSFIELTMSIMVLGILAAIASPIYSKSLLTYRAEVAAQRIVQDIEQTQRIARRTNSSRSITFVLSDDSYTISGTNSLDRISQPYKISLGLAPYQVRFQLLATSTQPTISLPTLIVAFDRFGMPDQGCVLRVGTGSIHKQVDVSPTSGRVRVQ